MQRSAVFRLILFTPRFVKVTFSVNATRVEQRTDFDSLTRTSKPRKPLHRAMPSHPQAAPWLSSSDLHVSSTLLPRVSRLVRRLPTSPWLPIWLCRLRTLTCPFDPTTASSAGHPHRGRAGCSLVEADLMDIRNFGAKSIDEVKESLAALGMTLKDSVMPSFGDSESAAIFSDDSSI